MTEFLEGLHLGITSGIVLGLVVFAPIMAWVVGRVRARRQQQSQDDE